MWLIRRRNPRALGVLLCYNDEDILEEVIQHLLFNRHKLVAWDHGSNDGTAAILDKYQDDMLERSFIPRSFDFYKLYEAMSDNLISKYVNRFDWISWPDSDEILEGPKRDRGYYSYVREVFLSEANSIQFNNFNYWFTSEDDTGIASTVRRVRHYCLYPDCPPRIRSWRASATNIREFNHNPIPGEVFPQLFNLRHYPMRTQQQAIARVTRDRAGLERDGQNFHYDMAKEDLGLLIVDPQLLHIDDGSDLNTCVTFNWRQIYGYGPPSQDDPQSPSAEA
jgi:Glycosyl transferase family 2